VRILPRLADVSRFGRAGPRNIRCAVERALADRGHIGRARRPRHACRREAPISRACAPKRFQPTRPDVVYAHFLVPSGLIAALATRAPLVVTAHGRDVRNIASWRASPRRRGSSCAAPRRSSAYRTTCAASSRRRFPRRAARRGSCRAASTSPASWSRRLPRAAALPVRRRTRGAEERRALADAFALLGEERSRFAGDGALRPQLEDATASRSSARSARRDPSSSCREPRALAAEPHRAARAGAPRGHGRGPLGRRHPHRRAARVSSRPSRRARRPVGRRGARRALSQAASLPCPNRAARAAAAKHDVRLQAERIEAILSRAAAGRRA